MKLFLSVLFATLALNGVLSLPARTEDAEVIGGPRRISLRGGNGDAAAEDDDDDFTNFKGVIDTGSGYPFLQPNPSVIRVGFFDSFDDLFRRFSQRLFPSDLFGRAGSDSDEEDGARLPSAIDPKKANSTSTVKVVDGHKVEVNETVYGDDNSIFKLRVVNIRPLEEGENVEETEHKDIKPVTQGPQDNLNGESNESNEKREPLEKKPIENEIQGNIDEPEHHHSIAKKENIVETTEATTIIDSTMLPTTEDINAAFVTDNGLEQQEQQDYSAAAAESGEELNRVGGNGNNEFETNMSEENNNSNNSNSNDNNNDFDDNIDNVENVDVEHPIENNENTEEELLNDNLNESSSSSNADVFDNVQKNNDNNNNGDDNDNDDADADADAVDEDVDAEGADIEIVKLKKKNSNYLSNIRNKEREGESSSDDEDANVNANAAEMPSEFNKEWDYLEQPANEKNDLNNAIDGYYNLPIDLSNDIAVNYAPNLPINPDAEIFDVNLLQHSSNSVPKFEKLSLSYQPSSGEDWKKTPTK